MRKKSRRLKPAPVPAQSSGFPFGVVVVAGLGVALAVSLAASDRREEARQQRAVDRAVEDSNLRLEQRIKDDLLGPSASERARYDEQTAREEAQQKADAEAARRAFEARKRR